MSSNWPIDRILSGATTPSQCGPRSDGNEGILYIPQSYCITGASPSDCLISYLGHSFKESYPFRDTLCVLCSPSRLGQRKIWVLYPDSLIIFMIDKYYFLFNDPISFKFTPNFFTRLPGDTQRCSTNAFENSFLVSFDNYFASSIFPFI